MIETKPATANKRSIADDEIGEGISSLVPLIVQKDSPHQH